MTKQTAVGGFSHVFGMASLFLVQVIIARAFGPEGRGVFASVFAITGYLVLLLGTGHSLSNAFFVASGKQTPAEAAGSSVLGLIVSMSLIVAATLCIMVFRPSFAGFVSNQLLFLGVMSLPFHLGALFLSGILRGLGKSGYSYWYYGVFKGAWLIAIAVFYFLFSIKSMEMVFITKVIAEFTAFGAMLYFLRSHIDYTWLKPRFAQFRESVSYRLRFYFTLVANPNAIRIEVLIIPIFLMDESALGLYAQAIAILSQIMVVSNVVGYVLMPQVAKHSGTSAELVAQACRVVLAVTFILGILIMVASIYLVPLVFGKDFSPILPLMWIIFPGIVLQSICKILYHFFQGTNRPMTVSLIFFVSLVIMIAVDILLIPIIGIKGAAIGTLIAALLESGMFSVAFIRETKLRWYDLFVLNSSDWKYMQKKCFH